MFNLAVKLSAVLAIVVVKTQGLEMEEFENFELVADSEARFLGNTSFLDGIFNNSLITIGAFILVGIVLFGKN